MCVALCPNSCFKLTKIYNLLWVSNYQKCQLFCGKLWYFRCVSIFITNAFYGKTHGCHLSLYPWVLPWNYGKGHYMAKPIHYDFCHGIWLLPYVYDFSHGIPYYGLDSRCFVKKHLDQTIILVLCHSLLSKAFWICPSFWKCFPKLRDHLPLAN